MSDAVSSDEKDNLEREQQTVVYLRVEASVRETLPRLDTEAKFWNSILSTGR